MQPQPDFPFPLEFCDVMLSLFFYLSNVFLILVAQYLLLLAKLFLFQPLETGLSFFRVSVLPLPETLKFLAPQVVENIVIRQFSAAGRQVLRLAVLHLILLIKPIIIDRFNEI
jgi:hypothetical protein